MTTPQQNNSRRSSIRTDPHLPSGREARRLSGRLGVGAIVFMVVAASAPLTVISGSFPVGALLGNGVGAPSMFLVAGAILLLFAIGLSAMSRHVPKPGAFFTYTSYGLGPVAGMAAAWLAMLSYTAVQIAIYGYLGQLIADGVKALGGPALPRWLYALLSLAAVGLLGYRKIDLSGAVLGILLGAEIAIVLLLAIVITATGGTEGLSTAPFEWSQILSGVPAIGLMFAFGSFIGFESTAIYRDEAKDPERTVPRATYAAVILIAVFYAFATWALVMGVGPAHLLDSIGADPAAFTLTITQHYLGDVGSWIVRILTITSMFACVLAFHNVIARYQHAMARARVLPARLGRVHPSHLSPHVSSLVQTATALVLLGVCAALGLDPVLQVFTWFAGITSLSIVLLMALTCVAVLAYFSSIRGAGLWRTRIAPVLGLLGLIVAAASIVANYPLLIGDADAQGSPRFGALTISFLVVIVAFPLFGIVQALGLRRADPTAYAGIVDRIGAVEQQNADEPSIAP